MTDIRPRSDEVTWKRQIIDKQGSRMIVRLNLDK